MKSVEAVYKDYGSVNETIGDEIIEGRLEAIHAVYNDFLESINCDDKKDIILNERVVIHLIMDYFTDITRLKEFHGIEYVNQDKIIAYECSWIIRRKPIQILTDEREDLVYINEKFALSIFCEHLIKTTKINLDKQILIKKFLDVMLYYFKYRDYDAKLLEILIMAFKAGEAIRQIEEDI